MAETGKAQFTSTDPEHISISKSKGIKIDWKDGHRSEYTLGWLRDECPCASCTGAHGTEPQKSDYAKSAHEAFLAQTAKVGELVASAFKS